MQAERRIRACLSDVGTERKHPSSKEMRLAAAVALVDDRTPFCSVCATSRNKRALGARGAPHGLDAIGTSRCSAM
jgi:hypothetical protein